MVKNFSVAIRRSQNAWKSRKRQLEARKKELDRQMAEIVSRETIEQERTDR